MFDYGITDHYNAESQIIQNDITCNVEILTESSSNLQDGDTNNSRETTDFNSIQEYATSANNFYIYNEAEKDLNHRLQWI